MAHNNNNNSALTCQGIQVKLLDWFKASLNDGRQKPAFGRARAGELPNLPSYDYFFGGNDVFDRGIWSSSFKDSMRAKTAAKRGLIAHEYEWWVIYFFTLVQLTAQTRRPWCSWKAWVAQMTPFLFNTMSRCDSRQTRMAQNGTSDSGQSTDKGSAAWAVDSVLQYSCLRLGHSTDPT